MGVVSLIGNEENVGLPVSSSPDWPLEVRLGPTGHP